MNPLRSQGVSAVLASNSSRCEPSKVLLQKISFSLKPEPVNHPSRMDQSPRTVFQFLPIAIRSKSSLNFRTQPAGGSAASVALLGLLCAKVLVGQPGDHQAEQRNFRALTL